MKNTFIYPLRDSSSALWSLSPLFSAQSIPFLSNINLWHWIMRTFTSVGCIKLIFWTGSLSWSRVLTCGCCVIMKASWWNQRVSDIFFLTEIKIPYWELHKHCGPRGGSEMPSIKLMGNGLVLSKNKAWTQLENSHATENSKNMKCKSTQPLPQKPKLGEE